jgi:hypothetical protein
MALSTTSAQLEVGSRILSGEEDAFIAILSPSDAQLLLELNTNNRTPKNLTSAQYASDMKSGRWRYAGEAIKFAVDGTLLDGQHRLKALASLAEEMPDFTIKIMIITGLEKESQSVMDQGSKRTAGDNLGLNGIKNPNDVAAAARFYLQWRGNHLFTNQSSAGFKMTNTEVQDWVMDNDNFVQDCNETIRFKKSIDMTPRLFMAAYAEFRKLSAEDATEFFDMWDTGANLGHGHPVLALREKLSRIRREGIKTPDKDYLGYMILAWNAYREGKPLLRFRRSAGSVWTKETFPEPI